MWKSSAPFRCVARAACFNTAICDKAGVCRGVTPTHGTKVPNLSSALALSRRTETAVVLRRSIAPALLPRPKPTALACLRHSSTDTNFYNYIRQIRDSLVEAIDKYDAAQLPAKVSTMTAPGDFSFIADKMERKMLDDMYRAVTKVEGWGMLHDVDPGDGGFMFSKNEQVRDLTNRITGALDDSGVHSGSSFAFCIRTMQAIARYGWDSWVAARLSHNTN